ncbi:MAG: YqaE/Pmp3 family membrane protein [Chitinophagaceae bacterium]
MKRRILLFVVATITLATSLSPVFAASSFSVPSSTTSEPDPAVVKAAQAEFMALSKKEKKAKIKEVKKELKKFNKAKKSGADPSTDTVLLVILAILLPPLAVYLHQGEINTKFWISLVLTLLFWLPGVIYALITVLS